jgi:hypothetical protein
MAQATLSPQTLTKTAKALIEAYNDKNWERAKASLTPDFVYDEVATGRKVTGLMIHSMPGRAGRERSPIAKQTSRVLTSRRMEPSCSS